MTSYPMPDPPSSPYPPYPPYPPGGGMPPGPPPDDPLIPSDLGGWFDRWLRVCRRSYWRLTKLALLAGTALLVLGGVLAGVLVGWSAATRVATQSGNGELAHGLLIGVPVTLIALAMMAVVIIAQSAMITIVVTDAAGRRLTLWEAVMLASRRVLSMALWWLAAPLAVLVGILLLVVPGIYLAIVFNATLTCVIVIERAGGGRCFDLIKDRFWATLGRLLLGWVVLHVGQYAATLVFSLPMGLLVALQSSRPSLGLEITTGAALLLMTTLFVLAYLVANTAMIVVTYAELRGRENRFCTTARLADEVTSRA